MGVAFAGVCSGSRRLVNVTTQFDACVCVFVGVCVCACVCTQEDGGDMEGPTDAQYRELVMASMEEKAKASVVKENVGVYSSMAEFRAKLLAERRAAGKN